MPKIKFCFTIDKKHLKTILEHILTSSLSKSCLKQFYSSISSGGILEFNPAIIVKAR